MIACRLRVRLERMNASPKAARWTANLLLPPWRPTEPRQLQAVRRRMQRLARALDLAYGTPDLGNLPDPLDEAVYIILTYQTDLERARLVWRQLKARFPKWDCVLDSPDATLEQVLQPSGFQRARAKLIRNLLAAVRKRWGKLSLRSLESMTSEAAEAELRALPGLDIKGARCVLLYSLGRPAFPVDSNAFRFMRRYGVIADGAVYRRAATHDELQALVAPAHRYGFHVNLVVHGHQTCLPRNPRCAGCPLRRRCPTARGSGPDARRQPPGKGPRCMRGGGPSSLQFVDREALNRRGAWATTT
jgi:endonuclease III